MLRVIQSTDSKQAKSYYSSSDYYLGNEQELAGQWRGEAARLLGLDGNVERANWDALCDNRHQETGERLTARQRDGRTIGYDFNFHVPKSVSLLYAETRDERLLDAFRQSVDATMEDVEREAQTRVRKDGKNENRTTSNLVWGEFIHFTSRPVNGVPDPHLHAHCYVFNTTFDHEEKRWKAGQFQDLKRDSPYFEALFHARLAHKLAELGLPIARTTKGWELGGVEGSLVRKFSRRTLQIEAKAREMGISDTESLSRLGARTREHKQKEPSFSQLQQTWKGRMTLTERDAVESLAERIGSRPEPSDSGAAQRAIDYAIEHEFERKSVTPERMLLARALKHAAGKASVDQVLRQVSRARLIVGKRGGRRMVTTRRVLAEEKQLVDFARRGRGTARPFVSKLSGLKRDWLNAEQKEAVRHIVESRDRVILLRGVAGVGKTTLMQEALEAIEKNGTRVFAFAPSAEASRGVLRSDGFNDADTVAMLLKDERKQRAAKNGLIWIDEAGLLGSKTLADVFALAEKINARVLLSGDRNQHGSVERGSTLRLLEEEAGLKPAAVKEIQRQSGEYKLAVKALSEGRVSEGFGRLDALGWIREIPGDERHRQMAEDYVSAMKQRKSALVISPTHSEGHSVTHEIRSQLKDAALLGGEERPFLKLSNANLTEAERGDETNYMPGDVLVFHQNAKGFTRGQRVKVEATGPLPLDQKNRFTAYHSGQVALAAGDRIRITKNGFSLDGKHRLDNGSIYTVNSFDPSGNIVLDNGWVIDKEYGHLDHGYVVTSYGSQGKTVQQVFVGQGFESIPASNREQFYVSASRAKERVTFYTGNKKELLEAVRMSDERLTATELITGGIPPSLREHSHSPTREAVREEHHLRKELIHER